MNKDYSELFKILNEFFDKIYVVTLKRSQDRQEYFKKILTGLEYEIHWGFDGTQTTLEELVDKGLYNSHLAKHLKILYKTPVKDVVLNSVACTISHTNLYKKILDESYHRVLILEDDIMLEKQISPTSLIGGLNELPENWDLLYLGYLDNNSSKPLSVKIKQKLLHPLLLKLGFIRYDPEITKRRYPRDYSENLDLSGYHMGTHAYGITSSGALKLLRYQTPVSREIDVAITDLCLYGFLDAYSLKNRLFSQNRKELASTIETGEFKPHPI